MQAPTAIRFMYETLRYSMVARGLRFDSVPLADGSVVDRLSQLDGRQVYERTKRKEAERAQAESARVKSGGSRGYPGGNPGGNPGPNGGGEGDPPLAVFLHGLGSSLATWSSVLPAISRKVPLVAPDLPGFGRTPLPEGAPFATLREHVDAAHAFIDAVSPDRPVQLVGQSLGGWLAARVASERPERVVRLTLSNATGIYHPQILEQRRLFSPHDEEELVELWERMWYRLPMSFRLLKRQFLELTRTPVVRGFMDTVEEGDFMDEAALGRITAPTLLVWGMDDRLIDYEFATAYRSGVKDIRFRPIPSCGHVPQRESPRMFMRYVLPWLTGQEPPEPRRPGLKAAEEALEEDRKQESRIKPVRVSRSQRPRTDGA